MTMDLDQLEKELRGRKELCSLAASREGKALASRVDERALRTALQEGDNAALQNILRSVLSTPEGRALAEKVQKAAGEP